VKVSDDLRQRVSKRFSKVDKQVSELARLEVELTHERNPGIPEQAVVDVTLYLKGTTLRACERGRAVEPAINACADDLARQVKRHRVQRRRRREARAASLRPAL